MLQRFGNVRSSRKKRDGMEGRTWGALAVDDAISSMFDSTTRDNTSEARTITLQQIVARTTDCKKVQSVHINAKRSRKTGRTGAVTGGQITHGRSIRWQLGLDFGVHAGLVSCAFSSCRGIESKCLEIFQTPNPKDNGTYPNK